jgi:hypothetical protein
VSLRGGSTGIWKFVRFPGAEADSFFPRLHLQIRPVVGRPEKVVVASGGKSVCRVPGMILEASRVKEHFPSLRVCISIASLHAQLFFFL